MFPVVNARILNPDGPRVRGRTDAHDARPRRLLASGAGLLNDTWGGWDPLLAEVATEFGADLVCPPAGALLPAAQPKSPRTSRKSWARRISSRVSSGRCRQAR